MFSKSVRIIPVAAGLTVLILGFQNCSQARFTPDTGAASLKSTDGGSLVNGMPIDPGVANVLPDGTAAVGAPPANDLTPGSVASIPGSDGTTQGAGSGTRVCHHEHDGDHGDDGDRHIASTGKDHDDDEDECEEPEGRDHDDDQFAEAFSGICGVFAKAPAVIDVPASALDSTISGNSSPVISQFAKNVKVSGNSDSILVKAAESTSIKNNSGKIILVRSKVITQVSGNSGRTCLVANSVGEISGVSAHSKIIAKKIGSITGQSGDLHVYGAVIDTVTGSSARICLHNGAKILNQSGNSGSFFAGECK
jgi:hypothetical protein